MKALNIIGLAVAALSCVQVVSAQEQAAAAKLKAIVQLPNAKKPVEMAIERSDGKDKFYFLQKGTDQQMEAPVASCKPFVIQTPTELANALNTYRQGDLAPARKQMASVRKKYADYAGLPGSPTTISALYEISCAVRLQDWGSLKELVKNFPSPDTLGAGEAARLKVASVMANISDDAKKGKAQVKAIEELLKDKKTVKTMNSQVYGWLQYALGRAYSAGLPTDGTLSDEQAKDADLAIDHFCQCVASIHGSEAELPVDAMVRSMNLLYAMPGVKEFKNTKARRPMTKNMWATAPCNFRDAVAMANLLKTVYAPEMSNSLADELAPYFYNTGKDKNKEAEEEEAEAPAK